MNLNLVLIWLSFMAKEVEHVFVHLLSICTSFENCSFNLLSHLLIVWLVLLVFNVFELLYALDSDPLSMNSLQRFSPIPWVLSHSVGEILVIVTFAVPKLLTLLQFMCQSCSPFLSNWSPIWKTITSADIFPQLPKFSLFSPIVVSVFQALHWVFWPTQELFFLWGNRGLLSVFCT